MDAEYNFIKCILLINNNLEFIVVSGKSILEILKINQEE